MRPCIEAACPELTERTRCTEHERQRQARRNASPERRSLYDAAWAAESRRIRREQPWCSACGSVDRLTVDHPSREVWCRSCHSKTEASRRKEARASQ